MKNMLRYKCAVKEAIVIADYEFTDVDSYLCKTDVNCFSKAWRERFCNRNLTPTECLNMKIGPENVLSECNSHFKQVTMRNSVGYDVIYKTKELSDL